MTEDSSASRDPPGERHGTPGPSALRNVLPTPAYSWEVARVDLVRGYRWVRHQEFWLLFTVLVGAIGVFLLWLTFDATRAAGRTLAAGGTTPEWVLTATGVLWLFLTLLLVGDGVSSNGDLDNDGHYLTIRPAADVVGGVLLAAAAKFSVYTIVPAVAAGLGLAAGTGSLTPLAGMLAAAFVVVATATTIGYPVGFALKGVIRRSRHLGRLASVVGVLLGLAYATLAVTGGLLTVVERLEPVFQTPPVAWAGHLALATTPHAGADVTGALVLLGAAPVLVVAGTAAAVPAARYAWLADAARESDDEQADVPSAPSHRVDVVLGHVTREPATRGVASTTLLRAARSPLQFVFAAPPLLAAISFVEGAVTTGSVPWYVPWFVVWYGAWAAGAVLPLNPLGNQGATLPSLLTAPARGRHVVHGHVAAAALVGVPVTAVLAVGAGVLADSAAPTLAVLGVAATAAVLASAVVAAGIGAVFPRFEALDFSASKRAVPPSKRAYSLFSTYLTVAVLAAVLAGDATAREVGAVLLSRWLPWGVEVSAATVGVLGWTGVVAGVLVIPVAYRVAARRIETYELD